MAFFFSSRRRHTRCALVTGVQTCALPISQPRPVILVANKVEGRATSEAGLSESYELCLDEPLPISAEHGEGLVELYDSLRPYIDAFVEAREAEKAEGGEQIGRAHV